MHMTRVLYGLILLCAWMTVARAQAPTPSAQTKPITLEEAIQLAVQHNFEVQYERYRPEIAHANLSLAYAAYEPSLNLGARQSFNSRPGGFNPTLGTDFPANETWVENYSVGIGGPAGLAQLPFTGTRVGLSSSLNRSSAFGPGAGGLRSDFGFNNTESVGIELRQPLLKNSWIDQTRAQIRVLKNNVKFSEQGLRLQIMSIVTRVEQAYYELIFAREDVKVQEKAYELAERLLAENRKRVEVGAMAPLDEKQAESQAAASKAALLVSQRVLSERENALKNLLTDEYVKWHEITLLPAENLMAVPAIIDLQESWQKGLRNRPDLLQSRLDVASGDIDVRFRRNQLLPEFDLVGGYGRSGQDVNYGPSLKDLRTGQFPFHYFGGELSIPLGNRAARQNYSISKAQKEQAKLLLKKKEQDIMVEIDNAVKVAQTNLERVEATRQARLYAEAALEAEQKKLENGKSTSFFVLQLQRDLTARRSDEIRSLADYNNALAQLALVEGSVLERNRLSLDFK